MIHDIFIFISVPLEGALNYKSLRFVARAVLSETEMADHSLKALNQKKKSNIVDEELLWGRIHSSHGIEKPGKSREFVLVFFPGLKVWNFVENLEISRKVGKIVASAPPKVF